MSYKLEFEFAVQYHLQRPVKIRDVIDSLNGLAKLLPSTLQVLRYYDRMNAPKHVECSVKTIEEGSLVDTLLTQFFFESEAAARAWIQAVKDKTGIARIDQKLPILSPIIKGIVVCGGFWFLHQTLVNRQATETDNSNHVTLEAGAKAIIQIGSNQLAIPEAELRKLTETAARKPGVAKAACTFVRPAKSAEVPVPITLDGEIVEQGLGATIVAALPDAGEVASSENYTQILEETELQIRSCDMDYPNKGWHAIVPAVSNKRLPLTISPSVNREILAPRTYRANLQLEYTTDGEGNRKYKKVALMRLSPEAQAQP